MGIIPAHPEPETRKVLGILRDLAEFYSDELDAIFTSWAAKLRLLIVLPADAAPVDAVAATNTLTSNNTNVTAADTVTVNGKVYTFVSPVGTTEGNVLRGANADASLTNLAAAINHAGTPGTDYFCAAAHPTVSSGDVAAHALTFTARTKGADGNALTLAKSAVTLSVGGATFSGGIDGTPGAANDLVTYDGDIFICTEAATVATAGAWQKFTIGSL